MPACLITGATGALGPAVLRAFAAAGWDCRTYSRRPPAPGTAAASVPHTTADITDRAALQQSMAGADAVVHLAALLHVTDPPRSMEAEYRRINVDGTIAVFEAARAANVPRIVFPSTIAVYGEAPAGAIDEDSPLCPATSYARAKRDAEVALQERAAAGGPSVVILRLGAVYGPAVKGNYDRLVRAIARGRFVPVGSGSNRRTLVYEDDAARAIVIAATHPAAAGHTFNVTGGIYPMTDIVAALARAAGRRPPAVAIPLPLARFAIGAVEFTTSAIGLHPPISRAALAKYTEDIAVSGERLRQQLGFEPAVPLAEGWRRTVSAMMEKGATSR